MERKGKQQRRLRRRSKRRRRRRKLRSLWRGKLGRTKSYLTIKTR
jgi:hypothetical protein